MAARADGMIDEQVLTRVLVIDLQPRILSYFRRRCGNEADAWDAAQEVMVRILEVLPRRSFERIEQLESYTWITAHNLRTDRLRRQRPHISANNLDEQGRPLVSRDMDPAQRTLLRDILAQAARVLGCVILPRHLRMFYLKEIEGWSLEELARKFGSTAGSVNVTNSRTRRKLREILAARGLRTSAGSDDSAAERPR